MAYWLRFTYDRSEYVVDLASIRAFVKSEGDRLTFWLSDGGVPVVLHPKQDREAYEQVLAFVSQIRQHAPEAHWIRMKYDRSEYAIDLNSVRAFCRAANGRITFWLADNAREIVLHPQADAEAYQQVCDYIDKKTGRSL